MSNSIVLPQIPSKFSPTSCLHQDLPPFPPGEWLNIVRWKYVDLSKVLDSAHTTELDPKRTHVIDDELELTFQVYKPFGSIKSSADHTIAFNMYINAIAFVFPQRRDEFTQYHTYLSRLFHSIEPRYHSRVIKFGRAIRNQIAMQRELRLTDYSQFDQLQTTFLTSFGIGSSDFPRSSCSVGVWICCNSCPLLDACRLFRSIPSSIVT